MPFENPLSMPSDVVRWGCVVLGMLVAWRGARELDRDGPPRWLSWLAPLTAATLSLGYVQYYLRGGPRIIDATAYYLQARTFAAGMLTVPLPEPEHAVIGRFLVRAATESPSAAVIFPPGYPAVLAAGFVIGAPLAIGPLLAAWLVVATMWLARVAARATGQRPGLVVTYAALASVCCAALRYHTADTMSHGLAALCITCAVGAFLTLTTSGRAPVAAALALGLSAGGLFATRPASALALAATLFIGVVTSPTRPRPAAYVGMALGAIGPLTLWFTYQHAATGSWLSTAQATYYAVSDGPLQCFRYGFGDGIGCRGEHGTFVEANLANGYGAVEALRTTARRLHMHLSDVTGFAPAFVAVLVGARAVWRARGLRVLVLVVVAQWLAYAPFYFDGNYPGGGARMFVDVLPIEHVIIALGLSSWRIRRRRISPPRVAAALLAASFFGFAFHLGAHHEQLRDREGGQPMFRPTRTTASAELLFVDTDHGFNLAFDPRHPHRIARAHGDALDTLAWHFAGRPAPKRYVYSFEDGHAEVVPMNPRALEQRRKIEGESLWPPREQDGAWAFPRHTSAPCASRGRVLSMRPSQPPYEVRLTLPDAVAGTDLRLIALAFEGETRLRSVIYSNSQPIVAAAKTLSPPKACTVVGHMRVPAGATNLELVVRAEGPVGVDQLEVLQNR